MNFERVLRKVLWRLVTEGSISYRRIKRSFGLNNDALEDVRRELVLGWCTSRPTSTASLSSERPMGLRTTAGRT